MNPGEVDDRVDLIDGALEEALGQRLHDEQFDLFGAHARRLGDLGERQVAVRGRTLERHLSPKMKKIKKKTRNHVPCRFFFR